MSSVNQTNFNRDEWGYYVQLAESDAPDQEGYWNIHKNMKVMPLLSGKSYQQALEQTNTILADNEIVPLPTGVKSIVFDYLNDLTEIFDQAMSNFWSLFNRDFDRIFFTPAGKIALVEDGALVRKLHLENHEPFRAHRLLQTFMPHI